MSLFSQALSHKATMLSIDVETQVDIDDIDTQTPVEEVHAELSDDLNQMEKHIDDLEASEQAEVTLESLSAVLKKSLRNGGMTQVELETFAICQSAIGQTLKVSVSATPDLQSYGRLGAYEYTALSAEQTEQAKKGIKERIMHILKKIGDFLKRVWHSITFSYDRLYRSANSLTTRAETLKAKHINDNSTFSVDGDREKVRLVATKLAPRGSKFDALTFKTHIKTLQDLGAEAETKLKELVEDPNKTNDEEIVNETIDHLVKKANEVGQHLTNQPLINPVSKDRPISERLKFWKKPMPDSDLPDHIPVLTPSESLEVLKLIIASVLMVRHAKKLDGDNISKIVTTKFGGGADVTAAALLQLAPAMAHFAAKANMMTLDTLWAAQKYARWSVEYYEQGRPKAPKDNS